MKDNIKELEYQQKQELLLRIVETWNLSEHPELRGFRCANCQDYMSEGANHHWLKAGNYITPVHFCQNCEPQFQSGAMMISKPRVEVDREKFGLEFSPELQEKFKSIVMSWKTTADPGFKPFACDDCHSELSKNDDGFPQGWHTWYNMDKTLVEFHFCEDCAHSSGVDKYKI